MRFLSILLGLCIFATLPLSGCGGSPKNSKSERKSKKSKKRDRDKPAVADDADGAYRTAIDAEADGNRKKANKYYQLAIKKDSKHPRANQRYVHFLIDHGKFSRALKVAERFFDKLPGKPISYHTLADAAAANGDQKTVVSTMSGLLAFSDDDALAYEVRGRARLKMGESEDGIDDIRRAVKLDPENTDFLVSLGGGLILVGDRQGARKTLQGALKSDRSSSRAHLLLGLLSRMEGNNKDSLKHLKKAVSIDSEDARAHLELGVTQNLLGQDAAAEQSFGKAVDLDPDNGRYWYTYGELLRLMKRM
jgi:tetratricopeptide (TPR) repeat protein